MYVATILKHRFRNLRNGCAGLPAWLAGHSRRGTRGSDLYEPCFDEWHELYLGAPENGEARENPERAEYRVLRGGSWAYYAACRRSAFRYRSEPTAVKNNIGFRLVLEPLA